MPHDPPLGSAAPASPVALSAARLRVDRRVGAEAAAGGVEAVPRIVVREALKRRQTPQLLQPGAVPDFGEVDADMPATIGLADGRGRPAPRGHAATSRQPGERVL